MSKKSKGKYYVVWVGLNPGVYDSWVECQAQIKAFPNARYKSFKTKAEAEAAFRQSATMHISNGNRPKANTSKPSIKDFDAVIVKNSISVDAACSGNPGLMEYRAVKTLSQEEIFHMGPLKGGTNNIGEFLALVHALAMLDKTNNYETAIYTDSKTALSWLKNKKVKTTLKPNNSNQEVFYLLNRAEAWVKTHEVKNRIIKWDTENWGEIPADFGRK